jgi:predicted transcriptional regulator of viral defense system
MTVMSNIIFNLRGRLPTDVFTDTEVATLIEGTSNRRYGLVKRAIASGELIQLRRGVYCLGKNYQREAVDQFGLAQKIYAPSYVSLESALSHHGWIPEAVYTVTSACLKRSTTFDTPVGNFSFTRIPKFNFIGVERVKTGRTVYLLATPTKALADYIVAHKVELAPQELKESLRIENGSWEKLSYKLLKEIGEAYGNIRLRKFLRALEKGGAL